MRRCSCSTLDPRLEPTHRAQLGKVVALALVFCVAIVLSNVSLRIIPVSFNQVRSARGLPPTPPARQQPIPELPTRLRARRPSSRYNTHRRAAPPRLRAKKGA